MLLHETDKYFVRPITDEERSQAQELGLLVDQQATYNYAVINKETECAEFMSGNLPNAMHVANTFTAAVDNESSQEIEGDNVVEMSKH